MKRLLFIAVLIFLVACGEEQTEKFMKDFNENAQEFDEVELLDEDTFGGVKTEKNATWQELYSSSSYRINAKYDEKEKNIIGYNVFIEDLSYPNLEGAGYNAALVVTKTLGLDRTLFIEKYKEALEGSEVEYEDNGYTISLFDMFIGEEHNGITIHYETSE